MKVSIRPKMTENSIEDQFPKWWKNFLLDINCGLRGQLAVLQLHLSRRTLTIKSLLWSQITTNKFGATKLWANYM